MNHFNVLNETSLPMLPRIFGGVGSFFAISGFLMFASYEKRPTVKSYFDRRIRRILPPYVFIVLLAAVVLSCMSTFSLSQYFSDWQLYKYLISNLLFMNFIEPSLPGVFSSDPNHVDVINGALWTMKGEVVCYLSVPLIFALIRRQPAHVSHILSFFVLICFSIFVTLSFSGDGSERGIFSILAKQFRVFTFFFIGAMLNVHLATLIKYKWVTLSIVLALMYVASLDGVLHLLLRPFTDSILVIWCCIIGSWGHFLSRYNSVSYDMYLFHFPIIQVLIATGFVNRYGSMFSLIMAILLTVVLASLSWRYIGKPILNGNMKLCIFRH